jgi:hypothetical protein
MLQIEQFEVKVWREAIKLGTLARPPGTMEKPIETLLSDAPEDSDQIYDRCSP